MKIVIFGATEIGCLLATEFFEDHDITVIDKEENRTEEFDKLDKISFNNSEEKYDFFGIKDSSKEILDKNVGVLFYNNKKTEDNTSVLLIYFFRLIYWRICFNNCYWTIYVFTNTCINFII